MEQSTGTLTIRWLSFHHTVDREQVVYIFIFNGMSFWYELYRNDIPVYWTREGGNGLLWIDCHHFCFLHIHCYDIARIDMCIVAINIPDIQCTCNLYYLNSASWVFSPIATDFYNLPHKSLMRLRDTGFYTVSFLM